jgi:3-deoxy-D-manno-octulosonate 8-phosphate phosphatase (KDO 8-P phosphatase)
LTADRNEVAPPAVLAALRDIRLLALDVDGTLTDGRLLFSSDGSDLKAFHVHDGQGLRLLRDHGLAVALITARRSPLVERRAKELGIEQLVQGSTNKADSLRAVCDALGLSPAAAAFMGDDLPDLPAMAIAGLAIAPANAHPWILPSVAWQTRASGGNGAVREVCDALLIAHGKHAAALQRFGAADVFSAHPPAERP